MAHIRWSKGGEADVAEAEDDRVTVRSSIPSAPGSRLEGQTESGAALRVKVHRCVKSGDGFVIEGRLLDARRELREALAAIARPPGSGEPPSDG